MENELKVTISARLKEIRNTLGLSQEEVRDQTHIDVSPYECAKRFPKIETLHELASFYKVNISYFFN